MCMRTQTLWLSSWWYLWACTAAVGAARWWCECWQAVGCRQSPGLKPSSPKCPSATSHHVGFGGAIAYQQIEEATFRLRHCKASTADPCRMHKCWHMQFACMHSFVHSFTHSFIRSFVRSFVGYFAHELEAHAGQAQEAYVGTDSVPQLSLISVLFFLTPTEIIHSGREGHWFADRKSHKWFTHGESNVGKHATETAHTGSHIQSGIASWMPDGFCSLDIFALLHATKNVPSCRLQAVGLVRTWRRLGCEPSRKKEILNIRDNSSWYNTMNCENTARVTWCQVLLVVAIWLANFSMLMNINDL